MPMAADWSSLPSELLGLVADALLATGDVDCYVSLRAVCHHWRDATADPRGPDPRFLPRRWVMLGWPAASERDSRCLFLNVDTGRFVWKDMPVLRDHACVATDNDGLLLLQGPTDYNNFSALNPFTGAWIRFPLYLAYAPSGRVVAVGSSPMVMIYSFNKNYTPLETKDSIGQDKILKGASSNSSSLSHGSHICLMAKSSTVSPTVEPNIPRGDKDEDEYEEEDWVVYLRDKGMSVFKVLCKDKIASSHFFKILTTTIESQKLIWMHENTIDKKGALEREYANDVASLKNDLEEEQDTVASLEEQLETLEVSQNEIFAKLTKERDHAKAQLKLLKNEKFKVSVGHDKLVKDLDDLDKAHKALESEHSILTKSHEQLKASYLKEHAMLPSLLDMSCDDACATNSISCEASILKENVELMAQLELLTSNYGKLEENHGKLSSSHEDLLASHDRLKLTHEAIISKATPCEPHVGTSTSTQNAILSCASPSNSSTHNIAKSCDELSSLPCCSNHEDSTSSSTCVVTNHVEEIKELKAQVTSLKNDLVKSHEGKCKLDTMLSVQQSPNDKSGLGFKSNNKDKSKNNKNKKVQVQVKDPAKIVCFKCKIEGHHVRSCPLKKKQRGKRPQAQTHIQPQVEELPLPKKSQANAPIVEKSSEKKEKKRTCYICREKGHISSLHYWYLIQFYHH
ncbi:hypothetical protein QYE76_023523 [Lolium multiflorum]|uniref:CCHC-type domain-containing protein n=1 Tax=Lolium multiflorum TaxID=4521 RepID=A0AAD8VU76_LOLMU|nr:hypothetical protein QYE76_023523 [Lolium multiflorum]